VRTRFRLVLGLAAALAFSTVGAAGAHAAYSERGIFANGGSGDGGSGSEPGQLLNPGQADVNDASGSLYVADTGNNRVQVFTPAPEGGEYSAEAGVAGAVGLAIDQTTGDVYVATADGISKLDSSLGPVAGWTDPGVTGPLAVDPTSGDLLVADTAGNQVLRFESDGTANGSFPAERPVDLAAGASGELFVITSTGNVTGECGPTSTLERFSAAGSPEGAVAPLPTPGAVAVDPDDGTIVVATRVNEYFCEAGFKPEVTFLDAAGSQVQALPLGSTTDFSMVPGLTAQGGGSGRVYAVTRSPLNDFWGATGITLLEEVRGPEVTIEPASAVSDTEATLSGSVLPNATSAEWQFEYSLSGGSWQATPWVELSGEEEAAVSTVLEGLVPNRTYEARLVARGEEGTTISDPIEFTTGVAPPGVQTTAASSLTSTSAYLNGFVNPYGFAAHFHFEYGADTSYGNSVPVPPGAPLSAGDSARFVSRQITGLIPGATYHYRLVAESEIGVRLGEDRTFTVPADTPTTGRAWEMVSPVDKNGTDVVQAPGAAQSALDGNSVIFGSLQPFPGSNSGPAVAEYIGRRGATGWSTQNIDPPWPASVYPGSSAIGSPRYSFFSEDLSVGLLRTYDSKNEKLDPAAAGGVINIYKWGNAGNEFELVSRPEEGVTPASIPQATNYPAGASADFEQVLFETRNNLTADATGNGRKVYLSDNGEVHLVSVLPDGTPAPSASAGQGAERGLGSLEAQQIEHAISADGKRAFFTAPEQGLGGRLYMRVDGAGPAAETVWISESEKTTPDAPQNATFWTASADGGKAFFTTAEQLVDEDTNTAADLYRYDVTPDSDGTHLTMLSDYPASELETGVIGVIAAGEDGSSVYFYGYGGLVPDGDPSTARRIYLSREGDLSEVAVLGESTGTADQYLYYKPFRTAQVTPSGDQLLFGSPAALAGNDNSPARPFACGETAAAACQQIYLYDAPSEQLRCVSCNPSGALSTGNAELASLPPAGGLIGGNPARGTRNITPDGATVAFESPDPLVAADSNGVVDVYEWRNGVVQLVSSGTAATGATFGDITPSGRDIFFLTRQSLVGIDTDENIDLYDARVGGGIAAQNPPPQPAPCASEACRPPAAPPGLPLSPASTQVHGPADRKPNRKGKQRKSKKNAKKNKRGKKKGKGKSKRRATAGKGGNR
jgi:hypothetical protein